MTATEPQFRVVVAVAAMTSSLSGPPARAAEPGTACDDPRVRVEGRPGVRWVAPIVRACEKLGGPLDSDRSAHVVMVPAGDDLILEVTLEDGRSTLRRVTDTAALDSTLEALLALPPRRVSVPRDAEPGTPVPTWEPTRWSSEQASPTTSPRDARPSIGVEFGGVLAGRIAGVRGQPSLAAAGFAQLRVGSWLLGAGARWDAFQWMGAAASTDFEMDTLAVGFATARRFRHPRGDVDVGVSPRLVTETMTYQLPSGGERAAATTDIRLAAFVRATLGRAPLRALVEVDAELSPDRTRRAIRPDPGLPPLPAWSSGVGIGVEWGEP
jgi:hypothetical protein